MPKEIWTIGHSTLEWSVFVELLRSKEIKTLVDVRSLPGSRRYPQFNQETMNGALKREEIRYVWMPALGGRRKPRPDSHNTAWRHPAFRGYADYMETPDFLQALKALEALARAQKTAFMCSEAVWWRCHRGLISDALKTRGWKVWHVTTGSVKLHPYTPVARAQAGEETGSKAPLTFLSSI